MLLAVTELPAEQEVLLTTKKTANVRIVAALLKIDLLLIIRGQRVCRICFTALILVHPSVLFEHIQIASPPSHVSTHRPVWYKCRVNMLTVQTHAVLAFLKITLLSTDFNVHLDEVSTYGKPRF